MDYEVNLTRDYDMNGLKTLGWELTICNSLNPAESPVRHLLSRNQSYGGLLYDFLSRFLPMHELVRVVEVGGGYGLLMKDFMVRNPAIQGCMIDVSPFLLDAQRDTLGGRDVTFRQEDFLDTDLEVLRGFELAVLNENLGDFPTLVGVNSQILEGATDGLEQNDPYVREMIRFCEGYGLEKPANATFNANVGALRAIEKLCLAGVPNIWVGEHSCESASPAYLRPMVRIEPTGNPEKIRLMGHDEYSIKFSHLERVAEAFGYTSRRGPFADFVAIDLTRIQECLRGNASQRRDIVEVLYQFVEDLYRYEYLILTKA
jgi:hypothetical protein